MKSFALLFFVALYISLSSVPVVGLEKGVTLNASALDQEVAGEDPPLPLYPGAVRIGYGVSTYDLSYLYRVPAKFQEVVSFYREEMPKQGWSFHARWGDDNVHDSFGHHRFTFEKENQDSTIRIVEWEDYCLVHISYSPDGIDPETLGENLPSDIPCYPGALRVRYFSTAYSTGWEYKGKPKEDTVEEFYNREMLKLGWMRLENMYLYHHGYRRAGKQVFILGHTGEKEVRVSIVRVPLTPENEVVGEDAPGIPKCPDLRRISYGGGLSSKVISYRGVATTEDVKDFYRSEMAKSGWELWGETHEPLDPIFVIQAGGLVSHLAGDESFGQVPWPATGKIVWWALSKKPREAASVLISEKDGKITSSVMYLRTRVDIFPFPYTPIIVSTEDKISIIWILAIVGIVIAATSALIWALRGRRLAKCSFCGQELPEGVTTCPNCGLPCREEK